MRKLLSSILSAALLLAGGPGTQAFAQEITRPVVPVSAAGAGSAAAAVIAPLSGSLSVANAAPVASLPLSISAPSATTLPMAAPSAAAFVAAPALPRAAAAAAAPEAQPEQAPAPASALASASAAKTDNPWHAAGALRLAAKLSQALFPETKPEPQLPADTPSSLAQASLDIDPARAYQTSPEDWRDETLYSIVMDRFAKSADAHPVGDPKNGLTRHGGDLRGVIEKLDYIKESGVTTLLISPLTMTVPEAYHGYAPVHFLAVDPHLGTMADFKELVAKAHEKGLRVVLDWVINHSGPVFEYADGKTQWTGDGKPGEVEWTNPLAPADLKAEDFTRKRVITDWSNPEQATQGDFPPNYRHFATDRTATQEKLIHIAQWWMKETDIDGFRLDAVRHVAPGFLPIFSKAIHAYAAKLGKTNFLMLGENSTGIDAEMKPFLDNGSLNTLYNYPASRRENMALHGAAPTKVLEDSRAASQSGLGSAADSLVRFIDLHDTYRFLLSDTPVQLLKAALGYLMLSVGIPLVYYGTEQAFRQLRGRLSPEGPDLPADPQNREDMFADGQYKSESSVGDKFDTTSPVYRFLRALGDLRKTFPALRRGEQYVRYSDAKGAGVFAFSRIYKRQEVLVLLNTSGQKRSADMWVDADITPVGTVLEDALNAGYKARAYGRNGGSRVAVDVPPYGVRVLVRPAR